MLKRGGLALVVMLLAIAPLGAKPITTTVYSLWNHPDAEVLASLSSVDAQLRTCAATAAGTRGLKKAIPKLRLMLKDPDANVRLTAANALWKLGDRRGEPFMRQAIKDGKPVYEMLQSLKLLAAAGDTAALAVAKDYLRAGLPSERSLALEAIAAFPGANDAYDDLSKGLNDSATRAAAIRCLGERRSARGAALLAALDPDALGKLERQNWIRALGGSRVWRGVPALIRALRDSDRTVRRLGAVYLDQIPGIPHPWRADVPGASPSAGSGPSSADSNVKEHLKMTEVTLQDPGGAAVYAAVLETWWAANKDRFDPDAAILTPTDSAAAGTKK